MTNRARAAYRRADAYLSARPMLNAGIQFFTALIVLGLAFYNHLVGADMQAFIAGAAAVAMATWSVHTVVTARLAAYRGGAS